MKLVAAGDPAAQHALVVRLQGRASHRRLDSAGRRRSEDALQAALLEVLKSAGGFRAESTLESGRSHRGSTGDAGSSRAHAKAGSVSTSMPSSMSSPRQFPSQRPPTTCRNRFNSTSSNCPSSCAACSCPSFARSLDSRDCRRARPCAEPSEEEAASRQSPDAPNDPARSRDRRARPEGGLMSRLDCERWASLFDRRSVDDPLSEDEMAFSRQHEASCAECRRELGVWESFGGVVAEAKASSSDRFARSHRALAKAARCGDGRSAQDRAHQRRAKAARPAHRLCGRGPRARSVGRARRTLATRSAGGHTSGRRSRDIGLRRRRSRSESSRSRSSCARRCPPPSRGRSALSVDRAVGARVSR